MTIPVGGQHDNKQWSLSSFRRDHDVGNDEIRRLDTAQQVNLLRLYVFVSLSLSLDLF